MKTKTHSYKKLATARKSSEQGLTLIEALVGILLIALVLAVSTPPIMIAAATRIQNRRAEQAIQLAQQEIDRVRLIMEQDISRNEQLPLAASGTTPNNLKDVAAPSAICTSSCDPYPAITQVRDEGNFLIQVFRNPGINEASLNSNVDPTPADGQDRIMAFRLGVRVYAKNAQQNLGSLKKEAASLQMTGGLGRQQTQPLAVLYADFARPDLTLSLEAYRKYKSGS
jgi:type II secretory pathway pseudopilin PulG